VASALRAAAHVAAAGRSRSERLGGSLRATSSAEDAAMSRGRFVRRRAWRARSGVAKRELEGAPTGEVELGERDSRKASVPALDPRAWRCRRCRERARERSPQRDCDFAGRRAAAAAPDWPPERCWPTLHAAQRRMVSREGVASAASGRGATAEVRPPYREKVVLAGARRLHISQRGVNAPGASQSHGADHAGGAPNLGAASKDAACSWRRAGQRAA